MYLHNSLKLKEFYKKIDLDKIKFISELKVRFLY